MPAPSATIETIRANGLEIGYEIVGDGPPLIALHGATTSGRSDYRALLPRLSSAFRVHLPDARGHGTTRWDAADGFESAWLVDDLEAFADALGLEAFHLIGFSMGGMTALTFAARRPERVLSMVVAGIAPDREPRAAVARRTMDPERIERDDRAWAAELARLHDPVQGDGAWRRLLPAIAADVATQPLLSARDLHGIPAPTLVACGDRDPFVPVTQAAALARQIHGGHLLVVPDAGHRILLTHAPIVGAALESFYRARASVTLGYGEPARAVQSQEDPR